MQRSRMVAVGAVLAGMALLLACVGAANAGGVGLIDTAAATTLRPLAPGVTGGAPAATGLSARAAWNATLDPRSLMFADLEVVDMRMTPAVYAPPCDVDVTVTLKNVGNIRTGASHLSCFTSSMGDREVIVAVPSLRPDEQRDFTCRMRLTHTVLWLMVRANCWNEFTEPNSSNNERQMTPMMSSADRDFLVSDVHIAVNTHESGVSQPERQPVGGEPFDLVYTIRYNYRGGPGVGALVHMGIYVDDVLQSTREHLIGENAEITDRLPMRFAVGSHTIRVACQDPIPGQDPGNDQMSFNATWRHRAQAPYSFTSYAIENYGAVGGSPNLSYCINEARWFAAQMASRPSAGPFLYRAEDGQAAWDDWGGPNARANWGNLAYFVGHGNTNGPAYSQHGLGPNPGEVMDPSHERLGRNAAGQPTLRWATWQACLTLYDGVQTGGSPNFYGTDGLSRWFSSFQGLHSIQGMRSLGWTGWWYEPPWYIGDSSRRGRYYVDMLNNGYTFANAWFNAQDAVVWGGLWRHFEAAQLSAHTEGTGYPSETLTHPYPDYTGTPTGFDYTTFRRGTPTF